MVILNKLKVFVLFLSLFFLTACLDVVEEMTLAGDGSGIYRLTYDMSSVMKDEFTKNMFRKMLEEQSDLKRLTESGLELDSVLYFRDMPEPDRRKMQNQEFWNRVEMHIAMSEKDQTLQLNLQFEFDELSDIDYFYNNLDKLESQQGWSQNSILPGSISFELKKNKLNRLSLPGTDNNLSSEELAFAKTFFADARYKSIYHLPGKIKKTTIPGGSFEARTVIVNNALLDILNGQTDLEGMIKFKSHD